VLAFLKLIPLKDYLWAAAVAALLSYHFYTVHEAKVHASAHELAVLKDSSDKLVKANEEKLAAITQQHTADLTAEKVQHAQALTLTAVTLLSACATPTPIAVPTKSWLVPPQDQEVAASTKKSTDDWSLASQAWSRWLSDSAPPATNSAPASTK
jgi:hypothetical protein